jgi:hypothetical protein
MLTLMSFISLPALVLSNCGGEGEKRIELPAGQNPLPLSLGWGVILTNYIRIHATPSQVGIEITALAKGSIVKVLEKNKPETVKDTTSYWYKIDDGKNRGWLFGAHIRIFHTKEEAMKAAQELQ